jgi:hypothetical protein
MCPLQRVRTTRMSCHILQYIRVIYLYIQYKILHIERLLRNNIAGLRLAISDQNLELVPDYEQRVEVLKELKFLEANSTVSLKGRVACEVSCLLVYSSASPLTLLVRSILSTSSFSPRSCWKIPWQPMSPRK